MLPKRRTKIAISLSCIAALCVLFLDGFSAEAIGPDDLLLTPGYGAPDPSLILEHSQVERDINLLQYALTSAYGGRKFTPLQGGMARATRKLQQIKDYHEKSWSVSSLCRAIDEALLEIQDNHLIARKGTGFCSVAREAMLSHGDVGSNVGENHERAWERKNYENGNISIPVLALHKFPSPRDSTWVGFLDELDNLIADQPIAFAFDLRGTRGGNDAMARQIADRLYGQPFPYPVKKIVLSETPETLALWINLFAGATEPGRAQLRRQYEEKYAQAKAGELQRERTHSFSPPSEVDVTKIYGGRVFVLTDRRCVSSCEYLVEYLRDHPSVKTVGEPTGGYVHFGNVGIMRLPHSGIVVQMPTQYRVYWDGRWVERVGYKPTIPATSGENALKVAVDSL